MLSRSDNAVTVERPFKAAMAAFKRAFFGLRIANDSQQQTEPRASASGFSTTGILACVPGQSSRHVSIEEEERRQECL
jgi:hypothetical protein